MLSKIWKFKKSDFAVVFAKKKFNIPQFVTVYCELMKSNKNNIT